MIEFTQADVDEPVVVFSSRVGRRQLHTHIVLCESVHGAAARGFLEQHLSLLTDVPLIEGVNLLVRQFQQAVTTLALVLIGNHIGNVQSRRSGTLGIREHVQLRHVETLQEIVGLLETLGCLTSAPHHHVDTDKRVGHHRLDSMNLIGKQLSVIMSMHQP